MTERELIDRFDAWLQSLGDESARALANAHRLWQSGVIDTAAFEELVVQTVAAINATVRGGADVTAAAYVLEVLGEQVVPLGTAPITAAAERKRLAKAAATLAGLLEAADFADRLDRFARDEPARAAQEQMTHSYRSHGIDGYVRGVNAGACELCIWLRKEHLRPGGYVYPNSRPMHRHVGCRCTPIPTRKELDHE
ncbi:hypothetical protein [Tsukamurella paurometabola]|uniref:Phage head morphogenesis protein, SPP1 gp7 family n=1 Tax=Tsukamurella paurometabola TaxID=2061 RepID=A0A3P8KMC3_TSUPA|nr:hypothetical protein [Tsukamurella paurometabola]UEA84491.1 hypothetical protein LK411_06620 [Tsukamurella paurometabola]VDR37057.1 Uncharacterised protein [Tsukamurella paurometabola]